jgi:uncharacterized Fe-S cluster-containing radical SAM superfamily protein
MAEIDTDKASAILRGKAIDLASKKVRISRFAGSEQEKDIHEPLNCDGHGRVRHFRRETSPGWPENPLPIDPAAEKLGVAASHLLKAQVFQNSVCNWRCWYCFVPFDLLRADQNKSAWFTASEILDMYQKADNPPNVIDLSGGQPDLTPEWIPWIMRELQNRKLHESVYLWSDDNLSNDYLLRYLSSDDLALLRGFRNYGKVSCFKGFDAVSFAFNTGAKPERFDRQFEIFRQHLDLGIDLYAYVTITAPTNENIQTKMAAFVDRLQALHPNLPLRTIPLEIKNFTPMQQRLRSIHENAIRIQQEAIQIWNSELQKRYSVAERNVPIQKIMLARN